MDDYQKYLAEYGEYGEVTQVHYPIVAVAGLPSAKLNEIIVFETGERGQVISLHEDVVNILLFSPKGVKIDTKAARTDSPLMVPTADSLLGHVLDPFGSPLSASTPMPKVKTFRNIDTAPSGISTRAKVTRQMATGTAIVDIVIPVGEGQKQLILGDRKTGKSTFVLSTIDSQIKNGAIAIYAAIGKRQSEIKYLEEFMMQNGRNKRMVIIATSAFDSPGLIYLTPFTAMTLAEFYRDKGENVLLIMDDLLTHAKFYREFSLLAETFPGRDSYPGDIFHVHAKLLERAGNFIHEKNGTASISCLPIVETQEADLTGYIVSNLMSITDGHIFFDYNVFSQGRRPAINIPLSVTRVGKQTQDRISKDINRELSSLFAIYDKVENLSHFGSELSASVQSTFSIGEKVHFFFNQAAMVNISREVYLVLFSLVWLNILNDEATIEKARKNLIEASKVEQNRLLLRSLLNADSFNELLKNVRENKDLVAKLWDPENTSGNTMPDAITHSTLNAPSAAAEQPQSQQPAQSTNQTQPKEDVKT
jgi:F-type H+-transporting ATPase subunit alpha